MLPKLHLLIAMVAFPIVLVTGSPLFKQKLRTFSNNRKLKVLSDHELVTSLTTPAFGHKCWKERNFFYHICMKPPMRNFCERFLQSGLTIMRKETHFPFPELFSRTDQAGLATTYGASRLNELRCKGVLSLLLQDQMCVSPTTKRYLQAEALARALERMAGWSFLSAIVQMKGIVK